MKKSVLILGRQGAGKTTLLDKYLSESEMLNVTKTTFVNEEVPTFKSVIDGFDFVGVDEVNDVSQLEVIVEKMQLQRIQFIVCSQLLTSDVPDVILSKFDVVNVSHVLSS
jgi:adenylate kinase